jgi:ATPase subunit of ABC transporter with duplicated ATPase domains
VLPATAHRIVAPVDARDQSVLTARDLTVEIGAKTIVDGISLRIVAGEKVGLVGRNGAGKTTLLRVLGGAASPKSGTVRRPGATGYLSQDPRTDAVPDDTGCLGHVLAGRGLDRLQDDLEKARVRLDEDASSANVSRFAELLERFERAGGYAAESEVRRLAAGVRLPDDRLDLTLGALSGGERRRLELVRILFAGSELLLLDEPTNHLDADARAWLLDLLRSYRGALVVVSHDLDLLDDSITRVLHVDRPSEDAPGLLVEYKGTYSQYLAARESDEERLAKTAKRQAAEITRLSTLADAMRGQTQKRARVARTLDTRVRRLEAARVDAPKKRRSLNVRFPTPPRAARTVLTATELWKSFGTLDVFEDLSFDVGRGERLLVMGLNGAGKTTLLKVLEGRLAPELGEVTLGTNVSLGYYAQEHEGIRPGNTLLEHMRDASALGDGELRALLGMFDLTAGKAFQDAATLSGGEKTKLALAQLVAGRHNLLLLDEPTNNLDPTARAATGTALAGWPGTMIVVSHDVEFVKRLAPDRVLLMPEGTLDFFDDSMLDYVGLA